MTTWLEKIQINAPIEVVWQLFNEENFKRIMPKVVAHELVSYDKTTRTSIYKETYREGKRDETYELTEIISIDEDNIKQKEFSFTIANMIYSEGKFHLQQISPSLTQFTYSGETKGISTFGKMMMKLSSTKKEEKVVTDFLELVKTEAETDYKYLNTFK